MSRLPSLEEILNDPADRGLLEVTPVASGPSAGDRGVEQFEAINAFFDAHGRPPSRCQGGLQEKQLARRLEAIHKDPQRLAHLRLYDRHGLLPPPEAEAGEAPPAPETEGETAPHSEATTPGAGAEDRGEPRTERSSAPAASRTTEDEPADSLEEILADDELLGGGATSIFELEHVEPVSSRETPDEIAQRVPCGDFWRFEQLFERAHAKIQSGALEVDRFRGETQIREGDFFIVGGMLCLVDRLYDEQERGKDGRLDYRSRVIFANGTEANLLRRSLARALYEDENGRRVIPDAETVSEQMAGITHHDRREGVIYIVRTLRDDSALRHYQHLHKIGYTEGDLDGRLANAERDPTFLEAPVELVMRLTCYNLNPRQFETLVHAFLAERRVPITLQDRRGRRYQPREWFDVPLETAEAVCRRILDGSIVDYRLNPITGVLVPKERSG